MYETFIAVGIVISLIYNELTDLSPGGLITPGYFALFIDQPVRILFTFLIALMTYGIVRLMSKYLPIYGKRRFAVCVIVAITLKIMMSGLPLHLNDTSVVISSIGVIIPGLISSDMLKQTVLSTTVSLTIVTGLLFGVLIVFKGLVL